MDFNILSTVHAYLKTKKHCHKSYIFKLSSYPKYAQPNQKCNTGNRETDKLTETVWIYQLIQSI